MANIASQKKRILRAERERLENRRHTSAVKTYFRRLEAAVTAGDAELAASEHRTLVSKIDKAIKTGALRDFLDKSAIDYWTGAATTELKVTEIAARARSYVLNIGCLAKDEKAKD